MSHDLRLLSYIMSGFADFFKSLIFATEYTERFRKFHRRENNL